MRLLEGSHRQLAARLRSPTTMPPSMPAPAPTPTPTPMPMPTHTLWLDAAAYHHAESPPAAHAPNPAGYLPSPARPRTAARAVLAAGRASPVEGALSMGAAGYHPCMGAAGAVGAEGAGG